MILTISDQNKHSDFPCLANMFVRDPFLQMAIEINLY